MFIEESLYFAEWNYLYIVIQVYMVCTGNNQQLLIILNSATLLQI